MPTGAVEAAVRQILVEMGEDPDRDGLCRDTQSACNGCTRELTAGYWVDPDRLVNNAIFEVDYSEMVVVKDIPFYSLCEHHLLPFFGQAAVAYIPQGSGHRAVQDPAHRRDVRPPAAGPGADDQADRRLPDGAPAAQGVGVVIEASHLCAVMRGVRKPGTIMTTIAVLGIFRST